MRPTRDEVGMIHAMLTSLRSTCGRKQVGATIYKDGRPISAGYAGPPAGFPHCTPECLHASNANGGCNHTIHAEANAVAYASRAGRSTEGSTLYTTLSPCRECAKLVINSGISKVWYYEEYRITDGIDLLRKANIPCEILSVNPAVFMNLQKTFASGVTVIPARK